MKFLPILLCIALISCTDNGVKVDTATTDGSVGQISFSLSKATLPQNIASLNVTLTNLQTAAIISRVVVLSTDSVMRVVFDQIPVGPWRVKVAAQDATNGSSYSGESDVSIVQGQVTQLFLTLNVTTPGMGSLSITIAWPSAGTFVDYASNPILQRRGAWYDSRGVGYPTVMYDNGKYKMWFMNYGLTSGPYLSMGLAESVDGSTWSRVADTVLTPTANGWDAMSVVPGTVLKENGIYTMYYSGSRDNGIGYNIGRATSQDGEHWTKKGTIMPTVFNIAGAGVVKARNQYYLYYHTSPSASLHLATSADGVNWLPYAGNPVLTVQQPWEGNAVVFGSVVYENDQFTMLYANTGYSQSFGLATSTDGIHWVKDTRNPVFSNANASMSWAPVTIGYPFFVRVGNDLRVYYTGISYDGIQRIGYATKRK